MLKSAVSTSFCSEKSRLHVETGPRHAGECLVRAVELDARYFAQRRYKVDEGAASEVNRPQEYLVDHEHVDVLRDHARVILLDEFLNILLRWPSTSPA